MNKACLLNLGWKLQPDSEDFWCKVLRGKYESGNEQHRGAVRGSDSNLWKTLPELKPMLQNIILWIVGDGQDINAWSDVWIEAGLRLDQYLVIPQHMLNMKVCELVDADENWKKIGAALPPNIDNGWSCIVKMCVTNRKIRNLRI
jgi:hypothetical protein